MRKTIYLPWPKDKPWPFQGLTAAWAVIVDWFPPLTMEQLWENAQAKAWDQPEPHPDPNWLTVEFMAPGVTRESLLHSQPWRAS